MPSSLRRYFTLLANYPPDMIVGIARLLSPVTHQTLNPKPQTPNPKPQTPNPNPQTPNPKPQTPNPQPQPTPTNNPSPSQTLTSLTTNTHKNFFASFTTEKQ